MTYETKPQPATLQAEMDRQGITIATEFVPWSKSRNFKAGTAVRDRNLNWKVTVRHAGRDVLTTDYVAGIARAPSYPGLHDGRLTLHNAEALEFETEKGKRFSGSMIPAAPILPKMSDVIYSLCSDADAIDHPTFESWASDLDMDPDSRKAEAIYRSCLEIALKLRAALGAAGLQALRDACQDY